jgi:isopropylmalate/homocitrate/citramalate synthase
MSAAPKILECTLRDGSYVIDFQFTAAETFRIARRLDELGFPLIETGHGIGLGACFAFLVSRSWRTSILQLDSAWVLFE